jgi:hypothetical protein
MSCRLATRVDSEPLSHRVLLTPVGKAHSGSELPLILRRLCHPATRAFFVWSSYSGFLPSLDDGGPEARCEPQPSRRRHRSRAEGQQDSPGP